MFFSHQNSSHRESETLIGSTMLSIIMLFVVNPVLGFTSQSKFADLMHEGIVKQIYSRNTRSTAYAMDSYEEGQKMIKEIQAAIKDLRASFETAKETLASLKKDEDGDASCCAHTKISKEGKQLFLSIVNSTEFPRIEHYACEQVLDLKISEKQAKKNFKIPMDYYESTFCITRQKTPHDQGIELLRHYCRDKYNITACRAPVTNKGKDTFENVVRSMEKQNKSQEVCEARLGNFDLSDKVADAKKNLKIPEDLYCIPKQPNWHAEAQELLTHYCRDKYHISGCLDEKSLETRKIYEEEGKNYEDEDYESLCDYVLRNDPIQKEKKNEQADFEIPDDWFCVDKDSNPSKEVGRIFKRYCKARFYSKE